MANAVNIIVMSIVICSIISTTTASHEEDKGTRQVYLYRLLNWCITGRGWFRHKNPILQTMMFYLHGLSGYGGWALAIASFVFAPGISKWTRLVSYAASAICLAAMAVMTAHICMVDSNVGMRPARSHIPIIEIRFDDIVPPKSKFRKVFLYVYIFIQFAVCFGMLVL